MKAALRMVMMFYTRFECKSVSLTQGRSFPEIVDLAPHKDYVR